MIKIIIPIIFIIYNHSNYNILIDKKTHQSAQAGWSIVLRPKNYAALLADSNFKFSCKKIIQDKYINISCAEVLKITQKKPSRKFSKLGNFWLFENKKQISSRLK